MQKFENEYIYDLFMQYRDGNEEAYINIVNIYLKCVEEIIEKYFSNCSIEKEDLISIGKISLINALNSYNLDLDMNLKGYIYFWVRGHLEHYIKREEKKQDISNNKIFEDYIRDMNLLSTFDIDSVLEEKEIIEVIYKIFKHLDNRDKMLVNYYYGLEGINLSQRKIAKTLNMSRTNVYIRLNLIKKRVIDKFVEKGYITKQEEPVKIRRFHM